MEEQRDQQRQDLAARQPPSPQPAASPSEATPTPMAGNNGVDTSLQAAYQLAIQNAVERNWRRPETIPVGQRCRIVIVQIPGGEVISADVDPTCPYDALGRDSLERAVFAASPLPYAGFEEVFVRRLGLNFQPAD
jgi:colicin import membrane protein